MEINENLQMDVVRYIRTNKKLFKKFVPEVFNTDLNVLFSIYQEYYKEYESLPETKETLINYVDVHALELGLDTEDLQTYLKVLINQSFQPLSFDLSYVKTNCIDIAKRLSLVNLMGEFAMNVQDLSYKFDYDNFMKQAKKITRLTEQDASGMFLFKDALKVEAFKAKIFRSEWETLNSWRNKGGFYSPEMYIIMAEMKSFKTTNLINLALGFVRKDKAKGIYIDTENGMSNLAQRGLQNISFQSFRDFDLKKANNAAERHLMLYDNADIYLQYLKPGSTIEDVDDILDELEVEHGFIPDFIIYDDIDHLKPSDFKKSSHENIDQVYVEAISLNSRRNMFSFTASQLNREGIEQKNKKTTGISRSIGKIALAGGIYAIEGTEEELAAGLFKLVIKAQREGKRPHPDHYMWLKVNAETQIICEINENDEEIMNLLASNGKELVAPKINLSNFKINLSDR
jgi:hypothetical protein